MALHRTNIHEAINTAAAFRKREGYATGMEGASDLVDAHYPELIQAHDPEQGKTLLFVISADPREYNPVTGEDELGDALVSDVTILHHDGRMEVIPREVALRKGIPGFETHRLW